MALGDRRLEKPVAVLPEKLRGVLRHPGNLLAEIMQALGEAVARLPEELYLPLLPGLPEIERPKDDIIAVHLDVIHDAGMQLPEYVRHHVGMVAKALREDPLGVEPQQSGV